MTDGGPWNPPEPNAPADPSSPDVELEQSHQPPASRKRNPARVIGAAVAVIAVAGAAAFGVSRVLSGGGDGGAATPEEAGQAFLDALENEDVLGVIDVLLPGERETMRDPAIRLTEELSRMEVLSSDASLSDISGVDIVVEDESIEVEETNVDDIVNLEITASVSASVDGEELPIGDLVLDNLPDDADLSELDTDEPAEETSSPVRITAVEEDGRWYLSAFHSVAENVRAAANDPIDIPAEGVTPAGGASPEDAMDNLLGAVEALDLEAMIATLNPDEFQALQRYAPIFLPDAQAAIDEAVAESGMSLEIADPEYTVTGSGDTRQIVIDYFRAELSSEGESATLEFEDGCIRITVPEQESIDSCELTGDVPALDEMFGNPEPIEDLIATLQAAFDDFEPAGLVVKEVDGEWYFSPLATVAEQLLTVAESLDRDEIEQIVEDGAAAFEEVLTTTEDTGFDIDIAGDPLDPPTTVEPGDSSDSGDSGEAGESGGAGSPPTTGDPSGICYTEPTGEAASVCFQELIESGQIDASVVPVYVRFPECGLADIYWSGDYTSLPDEDFVAIVEETAPCFQELVRSGELAESDLPLELSHPECLEGRNWYTAIEDQEYNDAVFECAYG